MASLLKKALIPVVAIFGGLYTLRFWSRFQRARGEALSEAYGIELTDLKEPTDEEIEQLLRDYEELEDLHRRMQRQQLADELAAQTEEIRKMLNRPPWRSWFS
ncbi:hypothetical protein F5Y05DRAFT_416630 [Hypoxylon sp. FL0543]|nr:hypothetical protein F5Y05DRAFT_416630 [Hypoxylon sp. FL0543]